jgi:diguanylate cyclase (GGDEF)-like protein
MSTAAKDAAVALQGAARSLERARTSEPALANYARRQIDVAQEPVDRMKRFFPAPVAHTAEETLRLLSEVADAWVSAMEGRGPIDFDAEAHLDRARTLLGNFQAQAREAVEQARVSEPTGRPRVMMSYSSSAPSPHAIGVFHTLAVLLDRDDPRRSRHAIALLDLDRLTEINLVCGWPAGDAILRRVSTALEHALKPGEVAARWAGDQYLVLLPGSNRRTALRRTRRILRCVVVCATASGPAVSVSAGVAAYPVDGTTTLALVEAATVALRRAKSDGRGRVRGLTRSKWSRRADAARRSQCRDRA